MIGFMEQMNHNYAGLHLDPDHAVIGEMLAEKYGLRFRERGNEIELRFLSRMLPAPWRGPRGTLGRSGRSGRARRDSVAITPASAFR